MLTHTFQVQAHAETNKITLKSVLNFIIVTITRHYIETDFKNVLKWKLSPHFA